MDTQQLIVQSFVQLVSEGRTVLSKAGWDGERCTRNPAEDDYFRFRTEALNLVRRACGADSDHYDQLRRLATDKSTATNSFYFVHCVGVVEAAQRDFDRGLLFDIRALVTADVLGDFLEQSEALLTSGYFVPAASLAGAVLEDTLRQLCTKNGLTVADKTKLDSLNADLARANVYDKLIQKRITAIADIRNNADHGKFDKFSKDDVMDMVTWIRRFTADYLQ